ncbi:MAG: glutamyl-tRNA reductase [Deltaproteobacteria bacterium]|jgi:glutamyl-tRNA reductase|nr:glutamyl-tRNA reductase [Deltaproteobacteria bacterium]
MDIVVTGLGHRSAPVALRERLAGCGLGEGRGLLKLCTLGLISEGLVISTCNRVEIVAVGQDQGELAREMLALMAQASGLEEDELRPHVHLHANLGAVEYLFRVAAGLDSQVLGEPQILGQVKAAYRTASRYRTMGPVVSKLFHKSFRTAKRIRSETGLASGAVSMASAAVTVAGGLLGGLEGRRAIVVGAGEMASLVAAHLRARGVASLTVVGRSPGRARALAGQVGGQAAPLDDLGRLVGGTDLLVSAAAAAAPIVTAGLVAGRGAGLLAVMDLGVPRNVEEAVGDLPGVALRNVDQLTAVVQENQSQRLREAERASLIVAEEVAKFSQWLSSLATSPTIKDLIGLAEEARALEVGRTMAKNCFSPEQGEALEAMSRALVRRILHNPLAFAKGCHRHGRSDYRLDVFRRVFGLDPL